MNEMERPDSKAPDGASRLNSVDARTIWTPEKLNNILQLKSIEEPRVISTKVDDKSGAGNYIVIGKSEVYRITKFIEGDAYREDDFRLASPVIIAGLQEEDPVFLRYFPKILSFARADIRYVYKGKKPRIILYPATDRKDYPSSERVFTTIVEKFDPKAGWEIGVGSIGKRKAGGLNALGGGNIDALTINDLLLESRNALKVFASLTDLQTVLSERGMILEDIKTSVAVRKDQTGNIIEFKVLDIDDLKRQYTDTNEREHSVISWMSSPDEGFPFNIENIARHLVIALQKMPELAQQKKFKEMLYVALQLELASMPAHILQRAGIKFQQLSLTELRNLAARAVTAGLDTELEGFSPEVFVKVINDKVDAVTSGISTADVLGRDATERATCENFRELLAETYHLDHEIISKINQSQYGEAAKLLDQIQEEKGVELVPEPIQWFLEEAVTDRMMGVFVKGDFKYSDTIEDLFLLFAQPIYPGLPTYTRGNLENIMRLARVMHEEKIPLWPEFFEELATSENIDSVLEKYKLI